MCCLWVRTVSENREKLTEAVWTLAFWLGTPVINNRYFNKATFGRFQSFDLKVEIDSNSAVCSQWINNFMNLWIFGVIVFCQTSKFGSQTCDFRTLLEHALLSHVHTYRKWWYIGPFSLLFVEEIFLMALEIYIFQYLTIDNMILPK